MDAIKGWAIGICMASLAGTIVHFLSPSGNTQRMFKVVLSVFFITVLIYPLGLFNGDIDDVVQGYTYPDSYVDNAEQIGDIVLQQSINQLELAIGDEVRKFDIDDYEILIKTDIDEEERIVISSIDVVIGKGYADKKQELYTKLKESVDCQVNVYVGG